MISIRLVIYNFQLNLFIAIFHNIKIKNCMTLMRVCYRLIDFNFKLGYFLKVEVKRKKN